MRRSRSHVLVLLLLRVAAVAVTVVLATVGSWGLGFGVMTGCTSTTSACGTTQALLVAGWIAQAALLAVAVATCLPRLTRRVSPRRLLIVTAAVPLTSVGLFAATAWAAERSYCRSDVDYCAVEL